MSVGGGTNNANATTAYLVSPDGMYCPPSGPVGTLQLPVSGTNPPKTNYLVLITADQSGNLYLLTGATEDFFPTYKVTSILYSPPGNKSTQGYINGTTNGTATGIGQSFSYSQVNAIESPANLPLSGGGSWGWDTSSAYEQDSTQSWTNASGYTSSANTLAGYNPTGTNVMNHNWDTFVMWLNPQVAVSGTNGTPANFQMTSAAIPGISSPVADVIMVVAQDMEESSSGTTSVPLSALDPIGRIDDAGGPTFMPGLGAICANNTLYQEQLAYDFANANTIGSGEPNNGQYCTLANQCGCTPADFAPLLQTDPLLNYTSQTTNGVATYTAYPYSQTTDPISLDGSGQSICEENPIPQFTPTGQPVDCRYVMVPVQSGSTTPYSAPLEASGGSGYQQSDSTTSSLKTTSGQSQSISINFGGNLPFFSLRTTDTWTWTDTETTGTTTGTSNQMNLNLSTTTVGCTEQVAVYEDTVYHTFVFQVPNEQSGCQ